METTILNGNTVVGDKDWPASRGVYDLMLLLNHAMYKGTGVQLILNMGHNLVGPHIPKSILAYAVTVQNNLFGGYPTSVDIVPCGVFSGVFGTFIILHLIIFSLNVSRGHYFTLSLFWAFTCLVRMISFIMRLLWAQDIQRMPTGVGSEVFLVLPSILLVSTNLLLAQRLFTWRHPVGGSRKLFWGIMLGLYIFVLILTLLTILASVIPYEYGLDFRMYNIYRNLVKFTSVTIIIYTLTASLLIGLSYWSPTKKDENLYTYQPWWVESFSVFYFVKKGAAREAEESFMRRNHNHRHAIRVIAATHHHYNVVEGLNNQRGDLSHNTSLFIVIISTVLLFICAMLRGIVTFQARASSVTGPAGQKSAMYVCWGGFETMINAMYIIGRVDLRFYRPDILPATVRAIVTAEQSVIVSDDEEDEMYSDGEDNGEGEDTAEDKLISNDLDNVAHSDDEALNFGQPPVYGYIMPVSHRKDMEKSDLDNDSDDEFFF
ncbi:uncharacterized protein RJT20DRAFT_58310 [Scheffersomyces xylosifermentans]|uniref:uncharacterized protein n=1 Tax=Scheffersomyces xylosifermentans TaxID=1304137 RepID=UPI00315C5A0E